MEESRSRVARALRALEAAIEQLVASLAHQAVWIEVHEVGGEGAIRRACEAFSAIDYGVEDEVNQSVVCLGAIGVTPEIMERVQVVNEAKHDFKTICAELGKTRVRVPVKGNCGPTKAIPLTRVILRSIQRSDLNLYAAYRKIPVLGAPPKTITYTLAFTRSVYRKKIEEVEQQLLTRDHPDAAMDRSKLAALPQSEKEVALTKNRYVNIRANVLYVRLDRRGRGRAQFSAELPVMFVMRSKDPPPVVTFPPTGAQKLGLSRQRPIFVEETPFLGSLPVHRYLRS